MFTRKFWKEASERALRAGAFGALTVVTGGAFDLFAVEWALLANGFGIPLVASYLTSLAGERVSPDETGSLLKK